jgi:hypothetical protein
MSTDTSEEGLRGLVDLAGGDLKMAIAALEPHTDGTPVTYEEAVDRVVKARIAQHRNLTIIAPLA